MTESREGSGSGRSGGGDDSRRSAEDRAQPLVRKRRVEAESKAEPEKESPSADGSDVAPEPGPPKVAPKVRVVEMGAEKPQARVYTAGDGGDEATPAGDAKAAGASRSKGGARAGAGQKRGTAPAKAGKRTASKTTKASSRSGASSAGRGKSRRKGDGDDE